MQRFDFNNKPYTTPYVRPELKRKRTSLTQISAMLDGTLRRHGITKQVTAAIIVDRAHDVLLEVLNGTPLLNDVSVASYAGGILMLGCTNAAASFDLEGMAPTILARLQEECPDANIVKVMARVQIEKGKF